MDVSYLQHSPKRMFPTIIGVYTTNGAHTNTYLHGTLYSLDHC